jgi:hypothetical protein
MNLHQYIDQLMADALPLLGNFDGDAHIFDRILMVHWKKMRELAIDEKLFADDESQEALSNKLSPWFEDNLVLRNRLYSLFVASGRKDAFAEEYLPLKPDYYQGINALEFWLVMFAYMKHHGYLQSIRVMIEDAVGHHQPSHGGYVANLFYEVLSQYTLNPPKAIVDAPHQDTQINQSLEILKGALTLAGIIGGGLFLGGVITFGLPHFTLMLIGGCLIGISGLYSAYKVYETFAPKY